MRPPQLTFLCVVALLAACVPGAPGLGNPDGGSTKTGSDTPSKQGDGSCGTVTAKGICVDNGSLMRWCDGTKKLRETDCSYDAGFTCKVVGGEAKCVDSRTGGSVSGGGKTGGGSSGAGCGSIPATPVCFNGTSVMKWCQNDKVLDSDCAYDTGWICQESGGVAKCVDTQATPGGGSGDCGSVTEKGICVNGGSMMQWCQGGTLLDSDCAYDPKNTCKMIDGEAKCVPVGSGGTSPTPPPLGGVDSPCWTYRDCQFDMLCEGATASPPKQGMCVRP